MDGARREVFRLPEKMHVICGLWHHPNGKSVILATEQEVFLWHPPNGTPLRQLP
jgi:hypothetical protein